MIIYKITNKVNGKIYIGRTKSSLQDRWRQHCYEARTCGTDYVFHKAIREFGEDSFTTEVIFETDNADILSEKEIEFIKLYESLTTQNGYNTRIGGKFAEGMCKKISDRLKGRPLSPEHRQSLQGRRENVVPWNKGKVGVMKYSPRTAESLAVTSEKLKTSSSFVTKEQVRGYGGMVYARPEDKTPEEEARRKAVKLETLKIARAGWAAKLAAMTEEERAEYKAKRKEIFAKAQAAVAERRAAGTYKGGKQKKIIENPTPCDTISV